MKKIKDKTPDAAWIAPNGEAEIDPAYQPPPVLMPTGPADNPYELSPQELRFVDALMDGAPSVSKAIIAAGYTGKYPRQYGSKVNTRPRVQAELRRRSEADTAGIVYDPNRVIHRLVMVTEANPLDVIAVTEDNKIKISDPRQFPIELRYSIKSIKVSKDGEFQVTFHDKLRALQMLGQHFNMWSPTRGDDSEGGSVTDETLTFEARLSRFGDEIRATLERRSGKAAKPAIDVSPGPARRANGADSWWPA